jgi:hypothetical protein
MTSEQRFEKIEKNLEQVSDSLTVQARLVANFERKTDERLAPAIRPRTRSRISARTWRGLPPCP